MSNEPLNDSGERIELNGLNTIVNMLTNTNNKNKMTNTNDKNKIRMIFYLKELQTYKE